MSLEQTVLPLTNNSINVKNTIIVPDTQKSSYNPATDLNFWKTIGKNPNKSIRDYNDTFNQNVPMPFLKDKAIVYTYEGRQAYTQIINKIIDMYVLNHFHDIDINSYRFLDLLVNHLPLFERHWRKMVSDIREGVDSAASDTNNSNSHSTHHQNKHTNNNNKQKNKLHNIVDEHKQYMSQSNSHVPDDESLSLVSYNSLTSTTSSMNYLKNVSTKMKCREPYPDLAERLDHVFRHLGFHKKAVGGKDLDLHQFGQLKNWGSYPEDPI